MAGIYLHIPFCHKACTYCDFHFVTNLSRKEAMVEAMVKEITLRRDFLPEGEELDTIYLGGGTPSVLSEAELKAIFAAIREGFTVNEEAEISLEANPDDLSPERLAGLKRQGVNRLSIGIQSFREEDLKWMNRSHTAEQALACVGHARAAGIDNLSLDLIFGLPGLGPAEWEENLETAIALAPQHLSLYALTVEERTALHYQLEKGKYELPSDEIFETHFLKAHARLTEAGYEHYELSNYALPGFRSRHNAAYWKGVPYLGIGPSAHSFDGQKRAWNIANNSKYLKLLEAGESPVAEEENLGLRDRFNEYIMTGLRTAEGLDLQRIQQEFGRDLSLAKSSFLTDLEGAGHLWKEGDRIGLTPSGWIVSDHIIRELFWAEEDV